jgi:DNA-binding Xre family transcriptional regulator
MPRNDKLVKSICTRIDKLRVQKGLSYGELAIACDMDKGQLYDLLTNFKDFRISTLYRIAKGLEVEPKDLLV